MPAAVYRYRFVRSKRRLDAIGSIMKQVSKEFDSVIMPRAKTFLNRFTSTWDHKPQMQVKKTQIGGTLTRWIRPVGEHTDKWVWSSQGTSDHGVIGAPGYPIVAKNAPNLVYQQFYDAKTQPGGRFGGDGGYSGPLIVTKAVTHFGIKPREFGHHAAIWLDQWGWRRRIENAIRRGLRAEAKKQQAQTVEV